jgi:hypothetical protein
MDIKRKTCDIRTWKNISRHVLHQHGYTCPIALPVRRNPQHRSLLTVVSATSAPPCQPLHHQRNVCHQVVKRFTRQRLPPVNRKYFFISIVCIGSFYHKKRHNKSLLFGSILFKHGRHFDFWKSASEDAHACLLPRLSWSCAVLLSSDTHRKPITSITDVLLPFVTYLLTPLYTSIQYIYGDLTINQPCHSSR